MHGHLIIVRAPCKILGADRPRQDLRWRKLPGPYLVLKVILIIRSRFAIRCEPLLLLLQLKSLENPFRHQANDQHHEKP